MKSAYGLMKSLSALFIAVCFISPAFAGETQKKLVSESTLEQVMRCGMLKVDMSTFVLWAMNDKNGQLIGFEIDVAKRLANDLGVNDDFNHSDVTIAARLGSTSATASKQFMPKARLNLFDEESQAYIEAINAKAHAVVGSAPTPAFQALKHPETLFVPFDGTFTKEPIGFAVRKGDFDTINYLNNWITVVSAEGWLKEIKRYWFETKEWELLIQ